ncbi:MAG TPA: fibronectin type III domain-containing protein, partial [Flavobacterium sp.]|nr:fibronectin type III domain-containing protein [Flavobacterium sp.]
MGTYTEITGGTVLGSSSSDDQVFNNNTSGQSASITNTGFPIGFDFQYDGTVYTSFAVNNNGWIKLGNGSFSIGGSTAPLSESAANISNIVSGLGMDLLAQTGSELSYLTSGTAPNRKLTIQWKGYKRYNSPASTGNINFQIVLYETTNQIDIIYGTNTISTTGTPHVGIKGPNNTHPANINNRTSETDWAATIAGTSNSSGIAFSSTITPPVGLTFRWSPPSGCTETPVAGTAAPVSASVCSGATPGAITVTGATSATYPGIAYQWEESVNGTDWANVTGGTGATTLSYAPPAFTGTTIQYRLKVTCAGGGVAAYSNTSTVNPASAPDTQVSAITPTPSISSFNVSWTNGNGARRMVIVSTSATITDPVNGNGPAPTVSSVFAGTGQQIVYDGTGTSVTVTGLACNTPYYVKVYEYNRCGSEPYDFYYNVTGTPVMVTTAQPVLATELPVTTFAGMTDSNLSTILPGWYEAAISTSGGTEPSSANPGSADSTWKSATISGTPTARVNLYGNTINSWIVSPRMQITANTRIKFKAAITNWNSTAPDNTTPGGMQSTDDKVRVLISTDGCGATWTPLYTLEASNTTALTNVLTDFTVVLGPDYVGDTVQIAFQATDGPLNDDPDYDFHIADIMLELVPACDVPVLDEVADVTKNSATISWTAPTVGVPTGYEYVVTTTEGTPAADGTETEETEVELTGLTASTTYYVYARTICTDVYSDWTEAGTFTTMCDYADILTTTGDSVCGQG